MTILKYIGIQQYSDRIIILISRKMNSIKDTPKHTPAECKSFILPVRDVIDLIGGKWKLPIIVTLSFKSYRFKELEREIVGITPRMLSKELKDLEINGLVDRKESATTPITVAYSLTYYGLSLDKVIEVVRDWGITHRKKIMSK
ncbi:helix-turn-helix domain-containing protein [Aquimarina sp. I32.4]|uniref:winged helix-turn-helix transcriptional regulator n=1 Tax=Aquimarina sp. I32.4 TaxID=2053903 RepID=UPI001E31E829|nr:helix-turn-helix domain-containing protein [Aquimarina sp. I32.4]